LAAVTHDGLALQNADYFLKRQKDVVMAADRSNGSALQFVKAHTNQNIDCLKAACNFDDGV